MHFPFDSVTPRMSIKATFLLSGVIVLAGCSGDDEPFRKETTGVTGRVVVDGVPVPDGKFEISTYMSGDGVPAGDYTLAFMWGKLNLISGTYGGPDQLKGRYSDPKTSNHKFTVTTGEDATAIDLGTINLTTK